MYKLQTQVKENTFAKDAILNLFYCVGVIYGIWLSVGYAKTLSTNLVFYYPIICVSTVILTLGSMIICLGFSYCVCKFPEILVALIIVLSCVQYN